MARSRNNNNDGDNNARIKVVYFEAENVSSDLTSMIDAFANAIRSAPVQIIANPTTPAQIESRKAPRVIDEDNSVTEGQPEEVEVSAKAPTQRRQPRERKTFAGKPDDSLDWEGDGTPFVPYFKDKDPQDTIKKYLVIAAWFKRHGGKEGIDSNVIYNSYRRLGWQVLSDVAQPFREGAKPRNGYFASDRGSGMYNITKIGLQRVDDMTSQKRNESSPPKL